MPEYTSPYTRLKGYYGKEQLPPQQFNSQEDALSNMMSNWEAPKELKANTLEDMSPKQVDPGVPTTYKGKFRDAFANARANGLDVFSWFNPKKGRYEKYLTVLKGETKQNIKPKEVVKIPESGYSREATALPMPEGDYRKVAFSFDGPNLQDYTAVPDASRPRVEGDGAYGKLSGDMFEGSMNALTSMLIPKVLTGMLSSARGGTGFIDDMVNTITKPTIPANNVSFSMPKQMPPGVETERSYLDFLKRLTEHQEVQKALDAVKSGWGLGQF